MYDPRGDGIALFGRTYKTQFEHVRVQLFFLPLDSRRKNIFIEHFAAWLTASIKPRPIA